MTFDMDLRYQIPLDEMEIVGLDPWLYTGSLPWDAKRVDPGRPDNSVVFLRMFAEGTKGYRMPPLGRYEIDLRARDLTDSWILLLGGIENAADHWWSHLE